MLYRLYIKDITVIYSLYYHRISMKCIPTYPSKIKPPTSHFSGLGGSTNFSRRCSESLWRLGEDDIRNAWRSAGVALGVGQGVRL